MFNLMLGCVMLSVHAIATQLNPTGSKCSGIESVEWYGYTSAASTLNAGNTAAGTGTVSTGALSNSTAPTSTPFKLTCSQTPTGLKLLLLTSPRQPQLDYILKRIHEIYSDYALKNPFQTPEMPVRSEKFEAAVGKLVKQMSTNNYN